MGQDAYRYRPRENEAVNKSWLCDQGRLSYKYLNQKRLVSPMLGRGNENREATRAEALEAAGKLLRPILGKGRLAVLAAPLASVEDLLAGLTLAKNTLGVGEVFVGGRPEGKADHFLMTADKNPNRKGLEWIAQALGLKLRPFADLTREIEAGRVAALYALGTEVPTDAAAFAAVADRLEVFIAQAFNEGPVAEKAHVLLPAATHVEDEGSFVNLDGRIQRFRKAYPARGEALPHWRWAQELGHTLGASAAQSSSREVFLSLAPSVPELTSFGWEAEAPASLREGIAPAAAGADGRPPGYREVGAPRIRGI
jgi:NADH-quinone oxidoreductase subunit G